MLPNYLRSDTTNRLRFWPSGVGCLRTSPKLTAMEPFRVLLEFFLGCSGVLWVHIHQTWFWNQVHPAPKNLHCVNNCAITYCGIMGLLYKPSFSRSEGWDVLHGWWGVSTPNTFPQVVFHVATNAAKFHELLPVTRTQARNADLSLPSIMRPCVSLSLWPIPPPWPSTPLSCDLCGVRH